MSPEPATAQSTAVLMPKLGQAMTEGVVLQWHKRDGERVTQGEILVTVETDKATYDLEAQAGGILSVYVGEGQEVKVGTVIGAIGDGPGQITAAPAVAPSDSTVPAPVAKASARKRILASPKARQLAAEHGIDLAMITPSGADGVVSAGDVEKALTEKDKGLKPLVQETSAARLEASGRVIRERRKLTGIRKTSARRLQEAWQTIPHIVQMVEVDATELRAARAALRAEIPSLTVNDLILYAAAQVMVGLPDLNGTVEGDDLVLYDGVDIGFAIDTPRGLVVPVIRRAESMSIAQLAAESQRLIETARASRIGPENLGNATLSVSNLGMFGIQFGTPVINLGEPILVFVGSIEDRVVVIDGQIVIRPMLTLSIGYDHRVTDGVGAAKFTQGMKESLESSVQRLASRASPESGVRSPESRTPQPAPDPRSPIPDTQGELGEREAVVVSEGDGYAVQVRGRRHQWTLDEPVEDGGTDRGPTPVDAFLGALLSCMTVSFKAAARRRKVRVAKMEGRVQANPGRIFSITINLAVWSPDAEENVRALLDPAKRGCYVSGVLRPEIECKIELVVLVVQSVS